MSDEEKIVATLKVEKLVLSLKDLDMSMNQDLPWTDVFGLKDLKLLFKREIEENDSPHIMKNMDLGSSIFAVSDMSLGKLTAESENITLHLEDPTGSVNLKSEKQIAEVEDIKSEDLEIFLTEGTIGESVVEKLIGCDFNIKIFPPSAGLTCIEEAHLTVSDIVITVILGKVDDGIEQISGDLNFRDFTVSGQNSGVVDLEVDNGEVDFEEIGSEIREVNMEASDFDLDFSDMVLSFDSLEIESEAGGGISLDLQDYRRGLEDLVGNLSGIVDRGKKFIE